MLNSGNKIRALHDKKKNILTHVLSEKNILNETKNHNPPPLQVKWSVPKTLKWTEYVQFRCCPSWYVAVYIGIWVISGDDCFRPLWKRICFYTNYLWNCLYENGHYFSHWIQAFNICTVNAYIIYINLLSCFRKVILWHQWSINEPSHWWRHIG